MSPRNWKFRLEDMIEAIVLIEEYIKDMDIHLGPETGRLLMPSYGTLKLLGKLRPISQIQFRRDIMKFPGFR